MKNLILFLFSSIVLFTSCDRNVGNSPQQAFDLKIDETIEGIEFNVAGDVIIDEGNTQSVVIETQQEVMDHLTYKVHNGILEVSLDKNYNNYDFELHLTVNTLRKVEINGSGDILVYNLNTNGDELDLDIDGSGEIVIEDASHAENQIDISIEGSGYIKIQKINTSEVAVEIAGSGTVDLYGNTQSLTIDTEGSGDVDAGQLVSGDVTIKNAGSSDIHVNCNGKLTIQNSGSGDIKVDGNPTSIGK